MADCSTYLEDMRPALKQALEALAKEMPAKPYQFLSNQFLEMKVEAAPAAAPAKKARPAAKLGPKGFPILENVDPNAEMDKYVTAGNDNVLGKKMPSLDSVFEIVPGIATEGDVTIVLFWAQFSKSGYKFLPLYSDLQDEFLGKVKIVGVSVDPKADAPRKFMDDPGKKYSTAFRTNFRIVHDVSATLKEAMGPLTWGVLGTPHMFLVDKTGTIVWHQNHSQIGATAPTFMDQIGRQIEAVLDGRPLETNGDRAVEDDSDDEGDEGDGMDIDMDDLVGF